MSILKQSLILVPALMFLSACGGGDDCTPTDGRPLDTSTSTTDNCGNIGAAYTLAISYPETNAIEQLTDNSGFYSTKGTVAVTDQNGGNVPDGTIVQLSVIDTIFAQGTIGAGDVITGATFNDADPTLADGTATGFNTAGVYRQGELRKIKDGDLVLITNLADRRDQARAVAALPTVASIPVTTSYSQTYPNASYPAGFTTYIVGQSTLGAIIKGIDDTGKPTLPGYGKTKGGYVDFRLQFPANENTIRVGCIDSANDDRYNVAGSADVYVTASLGEGSNATIVDNQACFFSILPHALTADAATVQAPDTVTLTLVDANNINLPFTTITASSSDPAAKTVTDIDGVTPGIQACVTQSNATNFSGQCTATITNVGGGPATITFTTSSGATVDVSATD